MYSCIDFIHASIYNLRNALKISSLLKSASEIIFSWSSLKHCKLLDALACGRHDEQYRLSVRIELLPLTLFRQVGGYV